MKLFNQSKLRVAYDERCSLCMIFADFMKKMDRNTLIENLTARKPEDSRLEVFSLEERLYELHAVEDDTGRIYKGFDSILEVFKRTPLMWVFIPALVLAKYTGLGALVYKRIAAGPWRRKCMQGKCSI